MKIAGLESLRKQRRIGKIDSSQSFDSACLVETVDANNETDTLSRNSGSVNRWHHICDVITCVESPGNISSPSGYAIDAACSLNLNDAYSYRGKSSLPSSSGSRSVLEVRDDEEDIGNSGAFESIDRGEDFKVSSNMQILPKPPEIIASIQSPEKYSFIGIPYRPEYVDIKVTKHISLIFNCRIKVYAPILEYTNRNSSAISAS